MKQKDLKTIKKEISEESAINIGFYDTAITKIIETVGSDFLFELMREHGDLLTSLAQSKQSEASAEFKNALVTEAVRAMSFQEFKQVAPQFFSYQKTEDEILAETIPVTRACFDKLQAYYDSGSVQVSEASLTAQLRAIEYDLKRNDNEVLGVNPTTGEVLVLAGAEVYQELPESEWLLNQPMSNQSDLAQIMNSIKTHHLELWPVIQEITLDNQLKQPRISDELAEAIAEQINQKNSDWEVIAVQDIDNDYEDGVNLKLIHQETEEEQYLTMPEVGFIEMQRQFYDALIKFEFISSDLSYYEFLEMQYDGFEEDYRSSYGTFFNGLSFYEAEEFIQKNLKTINTKIANLDSKLQLVIQDVHGYAQGDIWTLGALYDPTEISKSAIEHHLEHEIGAWYRGSLTTLDVYDASGEIQDSYMIDREQLWGGDELSKALRYMDLEGFIPKDEAVQFEALRPFWTEQQQHHFLNADDETRQAMLESAKAQQK